MIYRLLAAWLSFFLRSLRPASSDAARGTARQTRSKTLWFFIGFLPLWAGPYAHAATSFSGLSIDANADARQPSIAVDQSSVTHVAYFDDGTNSNRGWVLYSSKTLAGSWTTPTQVGRGTTGRFSGTIRVDPSGVSLALGVDGNAYVAFFSTVSASSSNGALWCAKVRTSDGVLLSSTVVHSWTASLSLYSYTSIAVDGAGNPHIAYSDSAGGLDYARFDGISNSWILSSPEPDSGALISLAGYNLTADINRDAVNVQQLSLALDATGYAHIAYYDGNTQTIKYAGYDGTSWSVATVASLVGGITIAPPTSSTVTATSISTYSLSISWTNSASSGITYAFRYSIGNPTSRSCVDAPAFGASYPFTATDISKPYVITNLTAGTTVTIQICSYATSAVFSCDNSMVATTLTSAGAQALPTLTCSGTGTGSTTLYNTLLGVSLALDGAGAPRISYMDYNNSIIYYAVKNGASWGAPAAVDTGTSVPLLGSSLALDGGGNPSIAFGDTPTRTAFSWSQNQGTTWTTTTADAVNIGYSISHTLDASGNPRLAYNILNSTAPFMYAAGSGFPLTAPLGGSPRGKVGAPVNLTASWASSTTVNWAWVNSSAGASKFRLYEAATSTGPFTLVKEVLSAGATYTQQTVGLTTQTTFFAYVAAVNTGGGVTSSGATITFPTPGNPSVSAAYVSSVTVSYSTISSGGYLVNASTDSNLTGVVLSSSTTNASLGSLSPQGLSINTTYYLKVGALYGAATVYASVTLSTSTLAVAPAQPVATSSFTSVSSTTFTLNWSSGTQASGYNPAWTQYKVFASSGASPQTNGFSGNKSSTTLNLFAGLSGLFPNTTYYAQVQALNNNGVGTDFADLGSTSTLAQPVTGTQAYGIWTDSLTINWAALPTAAQQGSSSTAEGYLLQVSTMASFEPLKTSSMTPNVSLSTLTATGLTPGDTYYFRVGSLNWNSVPNYAASSSATLVPCSSSVGISLDVGAYDFASVAMGATTISTRAIVVTNTGTCGISESYSLSAATATVGGSPWSLAVSSTQGAGLERALLEGAFSTASQPVSSSFENYSNAISTNTAAASNNTYTVDGTAAGTSVPAGNTRNLWFKLILPSTNAITAPPQQTITVTITADTP